MSLRMVFQRTILGLALGSFHTAMASPLMEWEGSYNENETEDPGPSRGYVDGFVDDTKKIPINPDEGPEVVEVTMVPKRQMQTQHSKSHQDLALVPVSSSSVKDIKDETATTGENAKKQLPKAIRQEPAQNPYFIAINQVTHNLYN